MSTQKQQARSKTPQFSVIIPCWNAAGTLADTLKSLQAQTCQDWEAILVDDGSSDDTPAIAARFAEADPRFTMLATKRLGPSAARNLAGLSHAKGEFLAFLDSDDVWMPAKLSASLLRLRQDASLSGVYGQISFFRVSPETPETYSTVYTRDLVAADFLRDNPVCTMSNLVLRRAAFVQAGGFDTSIVHNEDVELLVRLAAAGGKIAGIDQHLVCYRTSLTGLSTNLRLMRAGWHKALETLQASPAALSPMEIAAADAGNLRYLARRALRTGAPGLEALRLAVAGARRSPKSFFSPLRRGGFTMLGALAAPLLPRAVRSHVFCR
ncbi:MAG: glycosyltransferase family 2 protein [Alphaproteobacteria bacterium]|nr:glycosyltransferase family 2 protein [Alphaproteobacteria bacterium]